MQRLIASFLLTIWTALSLNLAVSFRLCGNRIVQWKLLQEAECLCHQKPSCCQKTKKCCKSTSKKCCTKVDISLKLEQKFLAKQQVSFKKNSTKELSHEPLCAGIPALLFISSPPIPAGACMHEEPLPDPPPLHKKPLFIFFHALKLCEPLA